MRNYQRKARCGLLALVALIGCTTSPDTDTTESASTIELETSTTLPSLAPELYYADGVVVSFFNTVTCSDVNQLCTGLARTSMTAQDGRHLSLIQDSDNFVTSAELNGAPIAGTTLDAIQANAAAIGVPIDDMLTTVGNYFVTLANNAADKTLKKKIECVMRALKLGGRLTGATFACSGCFATAMGAAIGPPDWLAGLLTCSICARLTGKSIKDLYDLIKACHENPRMEPAELPEATVTD